MASSDSLPAPVTMNIKKGDTWKRIFRFTSGGVAIDLTGVTVRSQLRLKSTNALISTFTIGSGYTIQGASSNELLFKVAAPVVSTYAKDTYVLELEVTFPNGDVTTYIEAIIKVKDETTIPG